jgi:hypothetical protein
MNLYLKSIIISVIISLVVVLVFGIFFFAGYVRGYEDGKFDNPPIIYNGSSNSPLYIYEVEVVTNKVRILRHM